MTAFADTALIHRARTSDDSFEAPQASREVRILSRDVSTVVRGSQHYDSTQRRAGYVRRAHSCQVLATLYEMWLR